MKRFLAFLAFGTCTGLFASTAFAVDRYIVNLSGATENPPVASTGSGTGTVEYDPVLHTLRISFTFSALTSTTTASHIHCCTVPPTNAGVATTTPTFAGFPLGVTSGTFTTVLNLTQASSWNPAFITANGGTTAGAEAALAAALKLGQPYLNVHTVAFPSGEIRGFLVPEFGTLAVPALSPWSMGLLIALLGVSAYTVLRRSRS